MHRITSIVLVAASLVAVPVAAVGQDTMQTFGAALESCGAWTQGREEAGNELSYGSSGASVQRLSRESWVEGYITALNVNLPSRGGAVLNILEGGDLLGAFAWIDNYCAANPLDDLNRATFLLTDELRRRWLAAHPPQ